MRHNLATCQKQFADWPVITGTGKYFVKESLVLFEMKTQMKLGSFLTILLIYGFRKMNNLTYLHMSCSWTFPSLISNL